MQQAVKLAWHNRGYSDGFKNHERRVGLGEEEQRRYNRGYRIGQRQRAQLHEEDHVRDAS